MAQVKSIVNAADLKKALTSLPPPEAMEEVPFKAIKGTQTGEKDLCGGLFVGTLMLKSFDTHKKKLSASQTFHGGVRRSPKSPDTRLLLISDSDPAPLKEVAQACLHDAKLPFKIVVLKPGEGEPDTLPDETAAPPQPAWQAAVAPTDRSPGKPRLPVGTKPSAAPAPAARPGWQAVATPTAKDSTDPAVEAVRTQVETLLPNIAKGIRDPNHGYVVKQLYDRLSVQLRTATDPEAVKNLQATWTDLQALVVETPVPEAPSGEPDAPARLKFERLGGQEALDTALQKAGKHLPSDQNLTWEQRSALLQELTDTRTPFEKFKPSFNALESKLLKLRQLEPDTHQEVELAYAVYQQAADGDVEGAKKLLAKVVADIDGRLTKLQRNPPSLDDLAAATKRRLDQLEAEVDHLPPKDAEEARKLFKYLARAQAVVSSQSSKPGLDAIGDQKTGPERALEVAQDVLVQLETMRRRARQAARDYKKETGDLPRLFQELRSKNATRAQQLKAVYDNGLARAQQAGQAHDYFGALDELGRVQARIRGLSERLDWEEQIGDLSALKKATLGEELGHAAQGLTLPVQSTAPEAPPLVVKVSWKHLDASELEREADAYEQLGDHPNLARCLGMQQVTVPPEGEGKPPNENYPAGLQQGLVMEKLSGTVKSAMQNLKRRLKDNEITQEAYWATTQHILVGMLQGLDHLYEQGFVHADIKEDNVMFDANGVVKLIDMGLTSPAKMPLQMGVGPYGAPEAKSTVAVPPDKLTAKIDVFSLGVMLHWFAEGAKPDENLDKLNAPNRPALQYIQFLKTVLEKDPDKRPTPREALRLPFLNDRLLSDEAAAKLIRQM